MADWQKPYMIIEDELKIPNFWRTNVLLKKFVYLVMKCIPQKKRKNRNLFKSQNMHSNGLTSATSETTNWLEIATHTIVKQLEILFQGLIFLFWIYFKNKIHSKKNQEMTSEITVTGNELKNNQTTW